ncbi:1809_t:CDS:2, partial [Entrophospora sp. SA101]
PITMKNNNINIQAIDKFGNWADQYQHSTLLMIQKNHSYWYIEPD